MDSINYFIDTYFKEFSIPNMKMTDVIDVLIIAILIYYIGRFIKETQAWTLVKGIIVILLTASLAAIFRFHTVLWLFENTISVGLLAIVIIFQPELRRALEQMGRRSFWSNLFIMEEIRTEDKITNNTIAAIVYAAFQLAKVRTGALIVIEKELILSEYEKTGIRVDAHLTSQLLINIFEHNTPLHDGAVIVRNNRIVSATCYLPLTDNRKLDKELGTRHRAAVGISEISDSITVIVSEETGAVSFASHGVLARNVDEKYLQAELEKLQIKLAVEEHKVKFWKGRAK